MTTPMSTVELQRRLVMQVLENNHWVDVHTRCQTQSGMERIYKSFLEENKLPHKANEPVCGMRIITIHFEHLGKLPRKARARAIPAVKEKV